MKGATVCCCLCALFSFASCLCSHASRDMDDASSLAHSQGPGSSEGAPEFEVEEILAHRQRSSKREYLVKWKGLPATANSWELPGCLSCPDLLEAYNNKDR